MWVPFLLVSMAALLSCVFGRNRRRILPMHQRKLRNLSNQRFLTRVPGTSTTSGGMSGVKVFPPFHPAVFTDRRSPSVRQDDLSVVTVVPPMTTPAEVDSVGAPVMVPIQRLLVRSHSTSVNIVPSIFRYFKKGSKNVASDYLTPISYQASLPRSPFQNIFNPASYTRQGCHETGKSANLV